MPLALLLITACGGGGGGGAAPAGAADTSGPTVTAISPADNDTSVLTDAVLSITFDEPLDEATLTSSSFSLTAGSNAVAGTIAYDSATNTASFTPAAALKAGTLHTATLTTAVKDASGNNLAAVFELTFTTVVINTAPVASNASVSTLPGKGVTGTLVVTDAQSDTLLYSLVTGAENVVIDTSTGEYTYTPTVPVSDNTFTFNFKASDGLLDSNIATVTIISTVPTVPTSGLAATADFQRVTLNWDLVPGADSYLVYESTTSGAGITGTEYSVVKPPFYGDGLDINVPYYYVVKAVNVVGASEASSQVTATPVDKSLSDLTFEDTKLAACVIGTGFEFVSELTTLSCASQGISDLGGIEALNSLTTLELNNNATTDVSSLAALTGLTTLKLNSTNFTDVGMSSLSTLTKLTTLELSNNTIMDVSSLAALAANLATLKLSNNTITDVSSLAVLTKLIDLDLQSNSITDVSSLAELTGLVGLSLGNNAITNVTSLSELTKLSLLFLNNNKLGDGTTSGVQALTTLVNTVVINVSGNPTMSCSELTTLVGAFSIGKVLPFTTTAADCTP